MLSVAHCVYALRSFFIWQFKNTGEGEDGLLAIKKINNNAVICRDNNGRELIALGKGIGYEAVPRDIPLSRIERTFYEVDESYYPLAQVLPHDILTFSDRIVDIAKNRLPYQLSPNLVVLLGDHISFAIERAQKKLFVAMPLAWDVQQLYPVEYEIGEYAVSRIEKEFKTRLPANEAVGIALCIINGKKDAAPPADPAEQTQDAEMLEQITEIVEDSFGILINRKSFNFSRYASHLQYLFRRIHSGKTIHSENLELYRNIGIEFPDIAQCANTIALHIKQQWGSDISEEEKLYLILHINRICSKEGL